MISENPRIGACAGRIRTNDSRRTLSNWRLRFQEAPCGRSAGTHSIESATGHAVMFRRSAGEIIGGYNERIASTGEDADICSRLADAGWMTVVVDGVYAVSLQRDTVELLAMKELRHSKWSTRRGAFIDTKPIRPFPAAFTCLRDYSSRSGHNLCKLRWSFLPVDFRVLLASLNIVMREALRGQLTHRR